MANEGSYPLDYADPVAQIRLELGDTSPVQATVDGLPVHQYIWYSDEELRGMLAAYGQSPRRVAIRLLRNIGLSQALLLKKFSSAELAVDGPGIAAVFLRAADSLERQLNSEDTDEAVEFVQIVPTGGRQRTEPTRESYFI